MGHRVEIQAQVWQSCDECIIVYIGPASTFRAQHDAHAQLDHVLHRERKDGAKLCGDARAQQDKDLEYLSGDRWGRCDTKRGRFADEP